MLRQTEEAVPEHRKEHQRQRLKMGRNHSEGHEVDGDPKARRRFHGAFQLVVDLQLALGPQGLPVQRQVHDVIRRFERQAHVGQLVPPFLPDGQPLRGVVDGRSVHVERGVDGDRQQEAQPHPAGNARRRLLRQVLVVESVDGQVEGSVHAHAPRHHGPRAKGIPEPEFFLDGIGKLGCRPPVRAMLQRRNQPMRSRASRFVCKCGCGCVCACQHWSGNRRLQRHCRWLAGWKLLLVARRDRPGIGAAAHLQLLGQHVSGGHQEEGRAHVGDERVRLELGDVPLRERRRCGACVRHAGWSLVVKMERWLMVDG
mmetsp:Transcript_28173/g.79045  ORF Transcript_28173/g.79045 Transcript_28173/m.79045 type:complete len:313 (+) Transcript_28173:769-1707(+)